MTFSISGNTITQSGTDTSLASLSSVSGVTVLTIGPSTLFQKKYYVLPANASLVYNNLTIDPKNECLVLGSGNTTIAPASNSAVLQIGKPITQNGFTYASAGEAIISQSNSGNAYQITAGVNFYQGTLYWYSGIIRVSTYSSFGGNNTYSNNGVITGYLTGYIGPNAVLEVIYPPTGQVTEANQMGFGPAASLVIDGLTVRGYGTSPQSALIIFNTNVVLTTPPVFNLQGVAGLTYGATSGSESNPVTTSQAPNARQGTFLSIYGFKSNASAKGLNLFAGSLLRGVNLSVGSAIPIVPHNITAGQTQGYVEVRNEAKFTFKSQAGVLIQGVVVYMKDTNNGQRRIYNLCQQSINNTADNVYIQSSDSTGVAQFMGTSNSILLCAVAHLVANSDFTNNAGENIKDLRSKTNTEGADDFTFYAWHYNYSVLPINVVLHSDTTPFTLSNTLITDPYVTLTSSAATAKLASNFAVSTTGPGTITVRASSSFDDLYDCMKAYKVSPTQANLEFLGITNQIINASGNIADAGSVNIIGLEYFTSGSKMTTIKSTGALTANGAISNGLSIIGNVTQATPTNLTNVTISGNLTYNTNTPVTVTLTNCTITGTISNSGTGLITVVLANSTIGAAGSNVVSYGSAPVSLSNVVIGSNWAVVDATTNAIIASGTAATSAVSFTYLWSADKSVKVRVRYYGSTKYIPYEASGVITSAGLSIVVNQIQDTIGS